jgi:hypothetical protein
VSAMAGAGNSFFKYLGRAFVVPWNLLAFGVAAVAGAISGYPEVVLPLVTAGELVYLAGLATNQKFQSAIDAADHKAARLAQAQSAGLRAARMLEALPPTDRIRFERLRDQCIELRRIAASLRGDGAPVDVIDDMQGSGMNRLLWIHLKLLYTKGSIERFFETIDEGEIERELERAQQRIDSLGPPADDTQNEQRQRASLEDHLQTQQARLDNYRRAKENHEYILVELERLSSKISSLAELAINRQDPDFITHEVDSVSDSVRSSEKAIGELEFLTGITGTADEAPPELIDTATEAPPTTGE